MTGLTNGTTYYFTVAAVNSYGTSGYSNEASAMPQPPPSPPIELGATAGNAQVLLSWVDDSGADSYNVYEGTTQGAESSSPIATGDAGPSFTVTGLSNGTTYYFKVAAVDSFGVSAYSNEASATPSGTEASVYNYTINQYDSVGNVMSYTDSANGSWSMTTGTGASGYDTLSRLSLATWTPISGSAQSFCWTYDAFGNRTTEAISNEPFTNSPGTSNCQVASGATLPTNNWALYTVDGTSNTGDNGKNQLTGTPNGIYQYDGAGDIVNDVFHVYAYDGDGRICAVAVAPLNGGSTVTQYLYDADGTRVAKGSAHTVLVNGVYVLSCDTTQNGFSPANTYILGPGHQQMTELTSTNGTTWTWLHTNVWAAGELIATYSLNGSQPSLNFGLSDWLGTRRVLTDASGNVTQHCQSLPYGNGESCPPTPTEHLFTGKERDSESGNDYFGARYYASSMGRWLSPDWAAKASPVPYASFDDPQSLNLYQYARNNPLKNRDADGHDCPPDCGAATPIVQAFQDIFSGKAFKDAASQAWDNAKNTLGISDGKITTAGGRVDITTTVTTGNVQTTSTGDQSITVVPGAGATVDVTVHAPGATPGPVSVSAGTNVVSASATNSSVTVSTGYVAGPPVKGGLNGAVDTNAASKAASSVASAARGLVAPTPPPPPTPKPPSPPPCASSASGHC